VLTPQQVHVVERKRAPERSTFIGLTPTTQRFEGWPDGECVRAAHACILDLPLEVVPQLDPGTAMRLGVEQRDLERAWLATLGLGIREFSVDPSQSIPEEILGHVPDVPHFMSGISPRGFGHRCVGMGGELVWDPHPSRAGLMSVYSLGFLVKL
jgi:hypothetical protein